MKSVSPVFTLEEVQFEREIAKNQPEYSTVIGLPVTLEIIDEKTGESKRVPDWAVAIRFRLSDEERAAVAAGLDLVVTQLVFGQQLHPMNLQFCHSATKPVFAIPEEPSGEPLGSLANEADHKWEPDFSEGEPEATSKICGVCGRDHNQRYGSEGQLRIVPSKACEEANLPSAADLDAVVAEQEIANQSEQPEAATDQPQSEV